MKPYNISRSIQENHKLKTWLPAGRHHNFAAPDSTDRIHFIKAKGQRLVDLDGNEYLDLYGKSGSIFLGHAQESFIKSLHDCLENKLAVDLSDLDTQVSQQLCEAIPVLEQVRFSLSGSEAVANAVKLAQAATGRRKYVRFHGHYHGTALHEAEAIELAWNDAAQLEECLRRCGEIAAVLMEPICINGGGAWPAEGYLEQVRELCDVSGALLIFDETITSIRIGPGGAQKALGVLPDLCIVGKSIGNGIPVSAFGGKKEWMDLYTRSQAVHGGTFNGYALGLCAVGAVLRTLSQEGKGLRQKLAGHMDWLLGFLKEEAERAGICLQVQGCENCVVINCQPEPLHNSGALSNRLRWKNNLLRQCLQRYGILAAPPCRFYPSLLFDDADLHFFADRLPYALQEYRSIEQRLRRNAAIVEEGRLS